MEAKLKTAAIQEGKRRLEVRRARELQRQRQQGLGRPIISIEHLGYRFVAVGNRLHYGKWKTFFDFLGVFIAGELGTEWGNQEIAKPLAERHLIMQWYDLIARQQRKYVGQPGAIFTMPMTGAASAYNRLAYNLYLIAHNNTDIQTRLLARLRNHENFQGAYFETQVAAWLILAGFELEYEDESDISISHCEFTATYTASGDKYSVEAKSRSIKPDGLPSGGLPIERQMRRALTKVANHKRIVFIDLNKPLRSEADAHRTFDRAKRILRASENRLVIDGAPAPPAYVCLTNLADQFALEDTNFGVMTEFLGFKIPDYMGTTFPTIRDALRGRERHWPLFQLLKSIQEHSEIPTTFAGELPSHAFESRELPTLQIGRTYLVPAADGREVAAIMQSATVMGDKAICGVYDPIANQSMLVSMPMTEQELNDYKRHPDTYFGVVQPQGKRVNTIMELYDFFFDVYGQSSKEKLLELMSGAPDIEQLKVLSQKELAEIYCERCVHSAVGGGFKVKGAPS
jgi:hypothetical protein